MEDKEWNKVESEIWVPKDPDESISGTYLGFQKDVGENKSNLYTLEDEAGKQLNFWGSKVLDGHMIGVKPGQQVKIVFLGLIKKEGKKEYKGYDVFTQPLAA